MLVKILTAVVAALIVGAGVSAYLAVSTNQSADAARARAVKVLDRVDSDTKQIEAALHEPRTPELASDAQHPDFKGAKQRLDAFATEVDRTRGTVGADAVALGSSDAQLRTYRANLLALPMRRALDREQSRVTAMRSALTEADAAMVVERDQVHTLSAVVDAFDDLGTMLDDLTRGDVVAGLAMISGIDAKLQAAADLAKTNSNPYQVQVLVSDMRSALNDLKLLFQADVRNDTAAEKSLDSKLAADGKAVKDLHLERLDQYQQVVIEPHVERYHASLQAANALTGPDSRGLFG